MPILVTGGTGFLGVNLVRQLVGQGQRVRLLVRSDPNRLGLESDLIEFARGDVTNPQSVIDATHGCDRVYHLAAWVQISPWGMDQARRTNVEGTRNICAAALKVGECSRRSALDRPDWPSQDARGLGLGEVLEVAEHQHRPLAPR